MTEISLRKAVEMLIPLAERAMPAIGHKGSCGPESGCDGACMEAASVAETLRYAHMALKTTTPTKTKEPNQLERIVAINHPFVGPMYDGRPMREFIPGAWPTWGEFKQLVEDYRKCREHLVSKLTAEQVKTAFDMIAKANTVTILTLGEMESIVNRSLAGEFDK